MYCSINQQAKVTTEVNFASNPSQNGCLQKRWENLCELAIDTPTDPDYPQLLPAAVRGNPLDLEHVWQDAVSLTSTSEKPTHLKLGWYEGLPYWLGLTTSDIRAIGAFSKEVANLLERQRCRFMWAGDYWADNVADLTKLETLGVSQEIGPKGAFTQVLIPKNLRVRRPRYDHSHKPDASMPHPPLKTKWPNAGREGLAQFIREVLLAENIQVWLVERPDLQLKDYHVLAVATAPWFVLPDIQTSYESGAIKHVAVALCKLDHWLFSPTE